MQRREWMNKAAVTLAAVTLMSTWFPAPSGAADDSPQAKNSNVIVKENSHEGSLDWQLTRVRADRGEYRSPWLEGYCSRQSVLAGESIDIMISTNPAREVRLEIFRLATMEDAAREKCWS